LPPKIVGIAQGGVVDGRDAGRDLGQAVLDAYDAAAGGGEDRLAIADPLGVLGSVALGDLTTLLPDEVDREDLGGDQAPVGGEDERPVR
jgi:hypothetical protein